MDSILIRATNWIGDCIMSLPAVKEVRRLYPHAKLSILARSWVADIYRMGNFVDEVILFDPREQSSPPGVVQLARRLRRHNFGCALLLPNSLSSALVACLSCVSKRIGYSTAHRRFLLTLAVPVRAEVMRMHQSFYYLDLLHGSRLSPIDYIHEPNYRPDSSLEVSSQHKERALQTLARLGISPDKPVIGINPGAFYGSAKRWFPNRYAAVSDHLAEHWNAQILIFGSAEEAGIAKQIEASMKHTPTILAGRTTLLELIGLIDRCDLFITNDSGPMHLAAALRRPLIALFGSTDEKVTGPLDKRAQVIHKQVECTPCFLRTCPIDLRCYKKIEVKEVCEMAGKILANRPQGGRSTHGCFNSIPS